MAGKKSSFVNTFLVGCDPEVAVIGSRGEVVNVASMVSRVGQIGYDHSGRVLEFRPKPHKGTYTLVKELQSLVAQASKTRLQDYKWQAGALIRGEGANTTLGGHVWIDLNPASTMQASRVDALDRVTELLERLDILPREDCITRRRGRYGKFGDVRVLEETRSRFEYRTMPSWMWSPKVAFACLTLAKLAAANPAAAQELIKPQNADWKQLIAFVSSFKGKDVNGTRFLEKVASKGLKTLQEPPDRDVRTAWEGKLAF